MLRIRLTPKAARDSLGPKQADSEGQIWLKATVTSVPEAGRANAHLIKLLAKAWHLPKGAFSFQRGETDRWKVLKISGEADNLIARITKGG